LTPVPQPQQDGVTYAAKIDKAEAHIDWTRPATEVDRLIRGLSPFPGAWCEMAGERVKLLASRVVSGDAAPGTIIAPLTIACGDGAVAITRAQRPGKRAMEADEFLRGFDLPARVD
jgi:methionyl-tRNA formyltransferase